MTNTIFVQIASYRDPQLKPTLHNMLENADSPENLRIGICWQHRQEDKWDELNDFINDDRFKIIDIDNKFL